METHYRSKDDPARWNTMSSLPIPVYTRDEVRQLDQCAIEEHQIPGYTLMERAGKAALKVLQKTWPEARSIDVFCGVGNNGGDGYVLANLAAKQGYQIQVFQMGDPSNIHGDALIAYQACQEAGVKTSLWQPEDKIEADIIVDALLGTGLNSTLSDEWQQVVSAINQSGQPVLSIDIPSGLDCNQGIALGASIRAHTTVTFIGLKRGLLTGEARDYCGNLHFSNLSVPPSLYESFPVSLERISVDKLSRELPRRQPTAHKGLFGHVLIIGGNHGMMGAALLAGMAALYAGAGLVSVATRKEHCAAMTSAQPELMCHAVDNEEDLKPLLDKATMVAIGPGLGQGAWGQGLVEAVLKISKPLVMDADALNILSNLEGEQKKDNWVLTPHPGEAARLLGCSIADIQSDRYQKAMSLQEKYQGVVVLKGTGTIVTSQNAIPAVCAYGNPGMASGGMGDILTGLIASLIAQGMPIRGSACLGVGLHSKAADIFAETSLRGMLASNLLPIVRELLNRTI